MTDKNEEKQKEWYVDTHTGEISEGKKPRWCSRLGPYPSREVAAQWRSQAAARNEVADTLDREWKDTIDGKEDKGRES